MFRLRPSLLALSILMLAGGAPARASDPPEFDVEQGCRAARIGAAVADPDVCIKSENRARDDLKRQWPQFSAADRGVCVPLSKIGGMPTYTELVTCLEMSRDVRKLRAENRGDGLNTGLAPGSGLGSSTMGSGGHSQ